MVLHSISCFAQCIPCIVIFVAMYANFVTVIVDLSRSSHPRIKPHQKPKRKAAASKVRKMLSLKIIYGHFVFLVERKPERKKRRQENVASCEKCGVSFAKLLKRKVSVLMWFDNDCMWTWFCL